MDVKVSSYGLTMVRKFKNMLTMVFQRLLFLNHFLVTLMFYPKD